MTNRKEEGKAGFGTILVIAIIAIVVVIVLKNQGDSEYQKAVQAVLNQDKSLHVMINDRMRDQKPQTDEDYQRVSGYYDDFVDQMRRIDTGRCPRDFAEAYQRYAMSYMDLAGQFRAHPHIPSELEGFAIGVEGGVEGDPTKGVRQILGAQEAWKQQMHEKLNRANQTQQEMYAVASRYGAS